MSDDEYEEEQEMEMEALQAMFLDGEYIKLKINWIKKISQLRRSLKNLI